jgi:hypothetical protein
MPRESVRIAVTDSARGVKYEVAGWLSVPDRLTVDVLQVLVHGACYTHEYFDLPYQPESYSYVEWAHRNGWAVLNIDRLGNGVSSHPRGRSWTWI